MNTVIAIDPGKTGAIAIKTNNMMYAINMPASLYDLHKVLAEIHDSHPYSVVYMENVGFHVAGNHAQTSATFARHVGHLEAIIYAIWGTEPHKVRPAEWISMFVIGGLDKQERKNTIKALMQEKYPTIKVTLKNADALGLLTWAIDRGKR